MALPAILALISVISLLMHALPQPPHPRRHGLLLDMISLQHSTSHLHADAVAGAITEGQP
jgi:hypothetical protein